MVATQLGVNAPNGNVGVDGPTRNAESNRFSAGIVDGFAPVFNGMTIAPARSPVNVCQAEDTAGNVILIRGGAVDSTKVELTAPTTSGQSICYAIVYSVDPTATTTANNGTGIPQLQAVAGTAATTGSEQIPSDSTIRAAIHNGATAYVCVVCTVTVAYGQNRLGTGNLNKTVQGDVVVNGQSNTSPDPYRSWSLERLTHVRRYWLGTGRRSDGKLIVNTGTTLLRLDNSVDGNLPVVLTPVASGTQITGLHGDYLVSFGLKVSLSKPTWMGVNINLLGGAQNLGVDYTEINAQGQYDALKFTVPIRFNSLSSGITFQLSSNQEATMRSPIDIGVCEL